MASVHQRRLGGNILYFQGANRMRLLDAVGPDVIKVLEDFLSVGLVGSDAVPGWTSTLVEGGTGETTLTQADEAGGAILLTTDDADNDGINLQKIGEAFSLATGIRAVFFSIRLKASEATQSDFIAGLCITDTTLLGGLSDGVYFRKVDGSAAVAFVTEKNSTETETAAVHTFVADTYTELSFYWNGTTVYAFVNGVQVAAHTANIPDDELLTPSIHFLSGAAGAKTCTIDFIRAIQVGRA